MRKAETSTNVTLDYRMVSYRVVSYRIVSISTHDIFALGKNEIDYAIAPSNRAHVSTFEREKYFFFSLGETLEK